MSMDIYSMMLDDRMMVEVENNRKRWVERVPGGWIYTT